MTLKESFYLKKNKKMNAGNSSIGDEKTKSIVQYLQGLGEIENFLDIGCGAYGLTRIIKENCHIKNYYGCDITGDDGQLNEMGINFANCDLDNVLNFPYEEVSFDVILCSEVIEHLFAPDVVFEIAVKTLKYGGCLLVTTPNLGVWFNRALLMFGFQPAFSEVSVRYNVGKLYTTNRDDVGGHLRMFTLRALIELGKAYGLKTVRKQSTGGGPGIIGILTNIFATFPSLGNNLFCVMMKE